MRFASLGSGSRGNALVVEVGRTRVLLDCGFSATETVARLARLSLRAEDVDAVVVTHEHDDHLGGVARFAGRFRIPVHATAGTLAAAGAALASIETHVVDSHNPYPIGDLLLEPFPVPHDAREPSQYVFGDGSVRLGVLTDVGMATPHVRAVLGGCSALVLECNHDAAMLEASAYPASLKRRIASPFGHLANHAASALLASLDRSRLRHVIAAHLSEKNNTPELAQTALAVALGCDPGEVLVATQETGFGWMTLD
jgi:phosphoribosyl 1,2-cyclic phosphodiesterase